MTPFVCIIFYHITDQKRFQLLRLTRRCLDCYLNLSGIPPPQCNDCTADSICHRISPRALMYCLNSAAWDKSKCFPSRRDFLRCMESFNHRVLSHRKFIQCTDFLHLYLPSRPLPLVSGQLRFSICGSSCMSSETNYTLSIDNFCKSFKISIKHLSILSIT